MASTGVYINNREACSKACDGKSPVATPDPCVTPGPVVVPYPNTSFASDLKKGTSTVFVKGQMVSLQDKSYFSKSIGDQPATEGLSKGVLTAVIGGKSYFVSWSQNVKFEGLSVNRHRDFMTHNHGSVPGNTPTFPYIDRETTNSPCAKNKTDMETACGDEKTWQDRHCAGLKDMYSSEAKSKKLLTAKGSNPKNLPLDTNMTTKQKQGADLQGRTAQLDDCIKARKCNLVPFDSDKQRGQVYDTPHSKGKGCCGGQTGHHLISDASIKDTGCPNYNVNAAPTVCVEGTSWHTGSHQTVHQELAEIHHEYAIENGTTEAPLYDVDDEGNDNGAINMAVQSFQEAFDYANCEPGCIREQLKAYYDQCCEGCSEPKIRLVNEEGKLLKAEDFINDTSEDNL